MVLRIQDHLDRPRQLGVVGDFHPEREPRRKFRMGGVSRDECERDSYGAERTQVRLDGAVLCRALPPMGLQTHICSPLSVSTSHAATLSGWFMMGGADFPINHVASSQGMVIRS